MNHKKIPYRKTGKYKTSILGIFTGMFSNNSVYMIPFLLICWGWIILCWWVGINIILMILSAAVLMAACYLITIKIAEWRDKRRDKN